MVESCRPADAEGRWLVVWRVHNDADEPLHIHDAWVPHGRFRGLQGHVPVNLVLVPGGSEALELLVSAAEAPGALVENAFLILQTNQGRVFARMRIEFGDQGMRPRVMRVTSQSIQ